jgi:radical SAM superfamily enzyme YgiQ (UPF0313 family)
MVVPVSKGERMKLKLIMPRAKRLARNSSRWLMPPFGLTMIAALTPKTFKVSLEDENVEELNLAEDVDLVGISSFTTNVERGYEIADIYRNRGTPVVMGGFHVSAMPEEALQHANAVLIGEAEKIWDTVLEDFQAGKMKGIYKAESFHSMEGLPRPRLDLLSSAFSFRRPPFFGMVQTSRGCPYQCEFCSTSAFWGHKFRVRPTDEVVEEIRSLGTRFLFFVDDDIAGTPSNTKILLEKLIPLKTRWASQAGIGIAKDDELLSLAQRSGCKYLFVGFESVEEKSLEAVHKKQNKPSQYKELIRKIHDHGIVVQAAIVMGLDDDSNEVFQKIDSFLKEADVDIIQLNILYPYPGTKIRDRLQKEGRITSIDWSNYMLGGVNYLPHGMSQQELYDGYTWLLKKNTSYGAILKRAFKALVSGRHAALTLGLNLRQRRCFQQILATPDTIQPPQKLAKERY